MITVRAVDAMADSTGWPAIVERLEGNPLHLPVVHFADHDPRTLHALLFERGENVVGCAIGFASARRRLEWLRGGSRSLTLPTAPAFPGDVEPATIMQALTGYAAAQGFSRLVIQPIWSRDLSSDDRLRRYETERIIDFVIDLGLGVDEILARMHKTHRKNIRRAARELEVEEDSSLEGLLRLRTMQMASSQRAEENRSSGFGVRDERFFRAAYEHVYAQGLGHVLFARSGGRDLAALAWLAGAARVVTVRSGSIPEGYRSRAMYLLYDQLIRRAVDDGARELNAGGVPAAASDPSHPQHGLFAFKQGFGGRAVERVALDVSVGKLVRT